MQVNQISGSNNVASVPVADLTPHQCQQLIEFLSSKTQVMPDSTSSIQQQEQEPIVSCFNGIHSLSSSFSSILHTDWVMDTKPIHHICCTLALFHSYKSVSSKVTLPNNFSVPVTFMGSIHLAHGLILNDVFVPNFQFNLLSISSVLFEFY